MATKNHEIVKIRNGIARQLREARISAHLSLAQVEKLSGIPANIIDLLEVGIKPVDLGHPVSYTHLTLPTTERV